MVLRIRSLELILDGILIVEPDVRLLAGAILTSLGILILVLFLLVLGTTLVGFLTGGLTLYLGIEADLRMGVYTCIKGFALQ